MKSAQAGRRSCGEDTPRQPRRKSDLSLGHRQVINSDGTRYRLPDFARQKEVRLIDVLGWAGRLGGELIHELNRE